VVAVLAQNIKGEQCAIQVYNELLKATRDIDPVTSNMVLGILSDEVMHEEDLQNLDEDLKLMLSHSK
jgi:bacterioferritin